MDAEALPIMRIAFIIRLEIAISPVEPPSSRDHVGRKRPRQSAEK